MALLLRVLLPALLVYFAIRWLRSASRPAPVTGTCATCRFCRKQFDDGTLCTFGPREVFKNPVHVRNCVDYSRRA